VQSVVVKWDYGIIRMDNAWNDSDWSAVASTCSLVVGIMSPFFRQGCGGRGAGGGFLGSKLLFIAFQLC